MLLVGARDMGERTDSVPVQSNRELRHTGLLLVHHTTGEVLESRTVKGPVATASKGDLVSFGALVMNEDICRTAPFTEGSGDLFRIVDKRVTYFETYDSEGKLLNYPAQDIIYYVVPTDGYDCDYEGDSKISFFPSPPYQ